MSRTDVFVITDLGVVPERELTARLRALGSAEAARVIVQLRDRGLGATERCGLALRLRALSREVGARLLVNDDVAVAVAVEADGVHLPGWRAGDVAVVRAQLAEAGLAAYVSVACHSLDEVVLAAERGADAALLSPIFASPGKGTPLGLQVLSDARARLRARGSALALVALGGIGASNARACVLAGADAVAAIRASPAELLAALDRPDR